MSEYQYYEFRAVDRQLTNQAMASLRVISSRAEITSASFVNTYNFGDFRGDTKQLMRDYFDAFVYVANWGTHQFMLRLPKEALTGREYSPFCRANSLEAWIAREHLLISFLAEELESGWEQGEGWLDSLLPLRDDLLRGDLRSLYLGWLRAVQNEEVDDDQPEPPIPPGLGSLSRPLNSLVEFLDLESHFLEAAAEASPSLETPHLKDLLTEWIAGLPESEKDALLLQVAAGESPHVGAGLLRRFRSTLPKSNAVPGLAVRTAGELRSAADAHFRENLRRTEKLAELERERELRRKAAERAKRLDELAISEEAEWANLDGWISTKRKQDYDRAAALLVDLRDLAARSGRDAAFHDRLKGVIERHSTKRSFLQRLTKASLIAE